MYDNGQPVEGILVQITADVNIGTTNGWTDSNGVICGLVPKDEEMIIKVSNPLCNEYITTLEVGPFATNVVLDPIVIPTPNKLGTGTVVCNGAPVSNAQVLLNYTSGISAGALARKDSVIGNSTCAVAPSFRFNSLPLLSLNSALIIP